MISVTDKIYSRIKRLGKGSAFVAKDFMDIANRGSVDVALSGLVKAGTIRRVLRGVYEYPRYSDFLNKPLTPDYHNVTKAYARSIGAKIMPTGAVAANILGLTEQVPAKIIYLTTSNSKTLQIGGRKIILKKAAARNFMGDDKSRMVITALSFLGEDSIDCEIISKLQSKLSKTERKKLLKIAKYEKSWIAEAARRISEQDTNG